MRELVVNTEPFLGKTGDNSAGRASCFVSLVGDEGAECDSDVLSGDVSVTGKGWGWA